MISSIKNEFLLEQEEYMDEFLSLDIAREAEKRMVTLLQTGLMDKILVVTQLKDYNPKSTPDDNVPLDKDGDGDPCREEWDYRYIVGMLLDLAVILRLGISFVVHQCARVFANLGIHMNEE